MKRIDCKGIILLLLSFSLFLSAYSGDFDLKTNWRYTVQDPGGAGIPLPFPNSKNANSLIISGGKKVIRLGASGNEMFSFITSENVMVPAIGDLNGDGKSEIVISTSAGVIYCVDESGKLKWKCDLKDNLYDFGSAVLSDIDGDGKLESLFNARGGTIYCLNAEGTLRWKVLAEPRACNPAVGDIDGDGKAEIFFGTDVSKIFCLDYQGRYLWHTEILNGVYGRSSPTLADLNGDGRYELIMPYSNTSPYPEIAVLDAHSGNMLWKGHTVMQNYGGTSVVDIDHDGKLDVIVVDKGNTVNAFNWDGQLKWQTTLCGHGLFFAVGVADFFNDGHFEIFASCRQTGPEGQTMFLLDEKGKVLREYKDGSDRQYSPVVADLNGDQVPELYMTDGRTKDVLCYTLEGSKAGGKIAWPCWKENSMNNGFIKSSATDKTAMEAIRLPRLPETETIQAYMGQNTIPLTIPSKYKNADLVCETRLTNSHQVTSSVFTWIEPKNDQIEVPFNMSLADESHVEFVVRTRESKEIISRKALKVSALGYKKDKDYLAASAAELEKIRLELPPADFSLASSLSASVIQMSSVLSGVNSIKEQQAIAAANKTLENNRKKIDFTLKYVQFVNRIRKTGNKRTFIVWQNPNPWDELNPEDIYPQTPDPDTAKVALLAMGNEVEAMVMNITNLADGAQMVKIYPYNLTDSKGKTISFRGVVELHEAIKTPSTRGRMVDEVIPKLNEGNTIYLAPNDTRKLWVNINTNALAPGKYTFLLGVESVSLVESVQTIQVNLEVSTVRVPDKNELAFNTWSSIEINDDIMREKVIKDLIDHKIGVLSMLPPPRFYLGDDGKVKGDWEHWDKYYTPLKDKIVCFVTGAVSVDTKGRQVTPEQYAALLKEAYSLGAKGMAERGIDKKQWAIYVMDEPALTGFPSILQAVKICREIRAAAPEMELYTDPAGMVTPETMKYFEGLIDIYSPQIDLLKDPDGRLLSYFHGLNKRLWFYEAPSPARMFHPLGHNRVQPWLAFDYGLTGCGYWNYNSNNVNNSWRMNCPDDYDAIYNDGTNIIPSRRWEASRDGAEDYHLLMMLKRKIAEFKSGGEQQKAIAVEAELKMNQIVKSITARVKKIKEISRDFIPYDVDYSLFVEGRKTLIGYLEKMNQMQ